MSGELGLKGSLLDKAGEDQGWDWICGHKKGMPAPVLWAAPLLSASSLCKKKERAGETTETWLSSCMTKETRAGSWLCPQQH